MRLLIREMAFGKPDSAPSERFLLLYGTEVAVWSLKKNQMDGPTLRKLKTFVEIHFLDRAKLIHDE
jgi:hypothetical protein